MHTYLCVCFKDCEPNIRIITYPFLLLFFFFCYLFFFIRLEMNWTSFYSVEIIKSDMWFSGAAHAMTSFVSTFGALQKFSIAELDENSSSDGNEKAVDMNEYIMAGTRYNMCIREQLLCYYANCTLKSVHVWIHSLNSEWIVENVQTFFSSYLFIICSLFGHKEIFQFSDSVCISKIK